MKKLQRILFAAFLGGVICRYFYVKRHQGIRVDEFDGLVVQGAIISTGTFSTRTPIFSNHDVNRLDPVTGMPTSPWVLLNENGKIEYHGLKTGWEALRLVLEVQDCATGLGNIKHRLHQCTNSEKEIQRFRLRSENNIFTKR